MTRARMAPTLRALVAEPWTADGGGVETADARRELRAILSVVHAAGQVIGRECRCETPCAFDPLHRAFARLARLSSPRRGRRA